MNIAFDYPLYTAHDLPDSEFVAFGVQVQLAEHGRFAAVVGASYHRYTSWLELDFVSALQVRGTYADVHLVRIATYFSVGLQELVQLGFS
ncbi:hypothetical protein ARUE_c19070 [Arthrobacter sp. Rue61a]|nr:hypothetical protein ARUE_c19070 [Arthrobacter sp. Rue61a]